MTEILKIVKEKELLEPDFVEAARFLDTLGGENSQHTFQTFDDSRSRKQNKQQIKSLAKILHGMWDNCWDDLVALDRAGAGIFVTINQTDGKGRSAENITGIRSFFTDFDEDGPEKLKAVMASGLPPHIVVESSPNHYHCYWLAVPGIPLGKFSPVQEALATKFGGDNVKDLPRVLRLPGFSHKKDSESFQSKIIHFRAEEQRHSVEQMIGGLDLELSPMAPAVVDDGVMGGESGQITRQEILAALRASEDGDASLFVRLYGDKFLFDRSAGKWFVWDGHHWIEDLKGTVVEAVEGVMDLYQAEVARQNNLETEATRAGEVLRAKNHRKIATELLSRISTLRSKHRKENILWRAGIGEDSLAITGEEWDRDPWLFGCLNGDIDLRDGSFGPGERSNYIKTVAPVEWTGLDTSCPAFEKFLSDILVTDTFESDPDMVSFNQRLLGCALAGQVREHIFPILWGPHGRNGKGTLCNLLKQVMGDYAGAIQTETLMQSKHGGNAGGPRSDLMALRGKRIVWASETEGWQHLSPSKVKFLSGGDLIKAREPFGKRDIEFTPSHQVLFLTNPKPRIMAGPGDPLWERLLLIPFHVSYVRSPDPEKPWQREADLSLSNKLEIEKSGVLSWLVRGTLLWLEQGLDPPARVTKATGDYRDEEDILGSFLADATDRGGGVVGTIKANDFYLVYKRWAEAGGVRVMSGTEFGREMPLIVDRKRASGGVGNSYQGIKWNVLGMELYMAVESEKREKAEAKSHDKK